MPPESETILVMEEHDSCEAGLTLCNSTEQIPISVVSVIPLADVERRNEMADYRLSFAVMEDENAAGSEGDQANKDEEGIIEKLEEGVTEGYKAQSDVSLNGAPPQLLNFPSAVPFCKLFDREHCEAGDHPVEDGVPINDPPSCNFSDEELEIVVGTFDKYSVSSTEGEVPEEDASEAPKTPAIDHYATGDRLIDDREELTRTDDDRDLLSRSEKEVESGMDAAAAATGPSEEKKYYQDTSSNEVSVDDKIASLEKNTCTQSPLEDIEIMIETAVGSASPPEQLQHEDGRVCVSENVTSPERSFENDVTSLFSKKREENDATGTDLELRIVDGDACRFAKDDPRNRAGAEDTCEEVRRVSSDKDIESVANDDVVVTCIGINSTPFTEERSDEKCKHLLADNGYAAEFVEDSTLSQETDTPPIPQNCDSLCKISDTTEGCKAGNELYQAPFNEEDKMGIGEPPPTEEKDDAIVRNREIIIQRRKLEEKDDAIVRNRENNIIRRKYTPEVFRIGPSVKEYAKMFQEAEHRNSPLKNDVETCSRRHKYDTVYASAGRLGKEGLADAACWKTYDMGWTGPGARRLARSVSPRKVVTSVPLGAAGEIVVEERQVTGVSKKTGAMESNAKEDNNSCEGETFIGEVISLDGSLQGFTDIGSSSKELQETEGPQLQQKVPTTMPLGAEGEIVAEEHMIGRVLESNGAVEQNTEKENTYEGKYLIVEGVSEDGNSKKGLLDVEKGDSAKLECQEIISLQSAISLESVVEVENVQEDDELSGFEIDGVHVPLERPYSFDFWTSEGPLPSNNKCLNESNPFDDLLDEACDSTCSSGEIRNPSFVKTQIEKLDEVARSRLKDREGDVDVDGAGDIEDISVFNLDSSDFHAALGPIQVLESMSTLDPLFPNDAMELSRSFSEFASGNRTERMERASGHLSQFRSTRSIGAGSLIVRANAIAITEESPIFIPSVLPGRKDRDYNDCDTLLRINSSDDGSGLPTEIAFDSCLGRYDASVEGCEGLLDGPLGAAGRSDVLSAGPIQMRMSMKPIFLKCWKSFVWIRHGPTTIIIFRSESDKEKWLNRKQSEESSLVKLKIDFDGDVGKNNIMGFWITEIISKQYSKGLMHTFKIYKWIDGGPTIGPSMVAAFGSEYLEDAVLIRSAVTDCASSSCIGLLENTDALGSDTNANSSYVPAALVHHGAKSTDSVTTASCTTDSQTTTILEQCGDQTCLMGDSESDCPEQELASASAPLSPSMALLAQLDS
eukprot:CAMPEP_0194326796 /NCGR_PEP_ID=MMETSP0171-20130528/38396_1 /TAXON_ID=218684 /ORGANISM="Corethron pennatum, Strain L29A3" /LENGTH=1250 /DNA_ID=CAMNT_0039086525 /DNA_START=277 /DNA_END=4026 /DNA_ORIENTATION=-